MAPPSRGAVASGPSRPLRLPHLRSYFPQATPMTTPAPKPKSPGPPDTSAPPARFDAPNPGDPGFEQPSPKTPEDPTNLPELPPQRPFPRGV